MKSAAAQQASFPVLLLHFLLPIQAHTGKEDCCGRLPGPHGMLDDLPCDEKSPDSKSEFVFVSV